MNEYTKYFSNCKGVFQGGGCKAISYIGAYKEAFKRGVNFSEVAGTSAGSIIAVFIAAGANPNQLENIISELDFTAFDEKPSSKGRYKGVNKKMRLLMKVVSYFMKDIGEKISYFILFLGYRKSDAIETFVEKELSKILNKKNGKITFADLKMPVSVISSDLQNNTIKVWNAKETPNESVAYAVRCSCAIPFFFQPVDGRYVDGGMLSNLPTFVFSSSLSYDKILAFSLYSADCKQDENGISLMDYLAAIANTIVDGAKDIQTKLHSRCYNIQIEIKGIAATDFQLLQNKKDVRNQLIEQGENEMRSFLNKENTFMEHYGINNIDSFNDQSQMRTQISFNSIEKNDHVIVASKHTKWCWELFLTLLKWRIDGSRITVYTTKDVNTKYQEEEEEARRRMLYFLGVELYVLDYLPINGFFFQKNHYWKAVVFDRKDELNKFYAKYYYNEVDNIIINSLILSLESLIKVKIKPLNLRKKIAIHTEQTKEIIAKLRTISFYKDANIYFKKIKVDDLRFITQYVLGYKYRQIDVLYNLYEKANIEPFSPASLHIGGGKKSLIAPPVVEIHNGEMYVIEGNTRCLYAYKHQIEELIVAVVDNVVEKLPAASDQSYYISEMLLNDQNIEGPQRYEGFNYHLFRKIEQSIRPYNTYLK